MARIALQMGHCFRTTGATGTSGLDADPTEQEFAHAAVNTAIAMLRTAGHDAVALLADVPDSAYGGYNMFVAVHCDGSTSASARGASVGYRNNPGAAAAAVFKQHYQQAGWSGGWRPDNYTAALAGYYGVRKAVAAGVPVAFIVECGFLTSPADEALLSFPAGPDRYARAVTDTAVALFGGDAPIPPIPTQEDDLMPFPVIGAPTDQLQRPWRALLPGKLVTFLDWDPLPASTEHETFAPGWAYFSGGAAGVFSPMHRCASEVEYDQACAVAQQFTQLPGTPGPPGPPGVDGADGQDGADGVGLPAEFHATITPDPTA
jgi:hypothetical protein